MAAVLSAERLEVSVDGLTLSPDPEERPGAEGAPLLPPPLPPPSPPGSGRGPGAAGEQPEPGEAVAGGAAEEARRLEQRWGFGLEELYGLALRFFKGEPDRPHPRRLCRALGRLDPSSPDLPVRDRGDWSWALSLGVLEVCHYPLGHWVTPLGAWNLGLAFRVLPPGGYLDLVSRFSRILDGRMSSLSQRFPIWDFLFFNSRILFLVSCDWHVRTTDFCPLIVEEIFSWVLFLTLSIHSGDPKLE